MTTSNADFLVTDPAGNDHHSLFKDTSERIVPGIGPTSIIGTIPFEKGDKALFYAGSEGDAQYKKYKDNDDFTTVAATGKGTYKIKVTMGGVCNGYVQHNDKDGNEFSKKSVHAPNQLNEDMTLSAGEAFFICHNY